MPTPPENQKLAVQFRNITILHRLTGRPLRFNQLHRAADQMSAEMLTQTVEPLRGLLHWARAGRA
jgi:hypothetical protein